jgi:hypothetical protein
VSRVDKVKDLLTLTRGIRVNHLDRIPAVLLAIEDRPYADARVLIATYDGYLKLVPIREIKFDERTSMRPPSP